MELNDFIYAMTNQCKCPNKIAAVKVDIVQKHESLSCMTNEPRCPVLKIAEWNLIFESWTQS